MNKLSVFIFLLSAASLSVYANDDSLTFSRAADLAVVSSIEFRQARVSQLLREGAWKRSLFGYLPRFGLNVSENDRLQKIGVDSFMKNYSISVEQLVWDGGRVSVSRNLERMELNLLWSGLDRMASEIADNAVSVYYNVLSSRAILEIRKEAFLILEEQRRILAEEVRLGLTLPVDLAKGDINLADAKLDILSLQLDLTEMERQFAQMLGLDSLPYLCEKVDINRSAALPPAAAAGVLAVERNPNLVQARHSISMKEYELKQVSNTWRPNLRLTGDFGLSGQRYPLTRYNWSVGLNIDFSGPFFQNRSGAQAGWEPPGDRTAALQNNLSLQVDPAAGLGKKQAGLALAFERDRYFLILDRVGRTAAVAVEKCIHVDQKRKLAIESAVLAAERCRIEELRLELGQITRLRLMETLIEKTQKDIAVVEATVALFEAERELERFLDLKPGELAVFASSIENL